MGKERRRMKVIPTEEYFTMVREQLSASGEAWVRVAGISMQPLLQHMRDSVIIVPADTVRLRTGDIVLYDRWNGRYALHRVIRKGKHGFDMAGDNQQHTEKNLPYEQITGVVSGIERNGRYISRDSLRLRIYGKTVAWTTYPRIFVEKVISKIKSFLKKAGKQEQEGEHQ